MNKYTFSFHASSKDNKEIRDIIYNRGLYIGLSQEHQIENLLMIISSSMTESFEIGLTLGRGEGKNGNSKSI
tara:strand:- start:1864 stop:2079 length:216 start_codon:yes stop_codon:yes gene_type:complete